MFMHHIGGGVSYSFVNPKQGIEGGTGTDNGHKDNNIGGTKEHDDDYEDDLDYRMTWMMVRKMVQILKMGKMGITMARRMALQISRNNC